MKIARRTAVGLAILIAAILLAGYAWRAAFADDTRPVVLTGIVGSDLDGPKRCYARRCPGSDLGLWAQLAKNTGFNS